MKGPSVRPASVLAAAMLVCGCSGFDVAGPPAPAPPSELTVALSSSPFGWPEIQAQWSPPAGAAPDGIVVERRVADGPWEETSWFAGGTTSGTIGLPQVPDGARVTFRAIAVDNSVRSTPTNEVAVQLPVAPAAYARVGGWADGTLSVSWERRSEGASAVRVDRRVEPAAGTPSEWQQVLLAGAATTTYHDADTALWRDGTRFAYRVVYLAGDAESEAAEARSRGGRPLTLAATAVHVAGVVRVSWTYAGVAPVQVRVTRRAPGGGEVELGVVEPPATTIEVAAPVPGFFTYGVQAKNPDAAWYDWELLSDAVSVPVLVPDPALAGVLDASVLAMPSAREVARAPSGAFALAWGDGWSTLAVHAPAPGGGWERWSPATTKRVRAALPGIHFDAQGRLHVLYEQETDASGWDVRHRWQDSEGWQDEHAGTILALGVGSSSSALDAGGDPHLLWQDCCATAGASLPMTYTVRLGGSWTPELFAQPWETAHPSSRLATDPASAPAVLAQNGSLVLLRRGPAGWSEEAVPMSGPAAAYAVVLLPAADRAVLVGRWSDPSGGTAIGIRERGPSRWYDAEPALTTMDPWPAYRAAISPDGARIAIATKSPPCVAVRDGGLWTVHPLAAVDGDIALGFTPAGKLWILLGIGGATPYLDAERVPHVLYEEP